MKDTNIKRGNRTAFAAILTGILASSCCTVPFILGIFGLSSVGFFVKFESYRPFFMSVALLLLGIGFYFSYVRKPLTTTGDSENCECLQHKPTQNHWGRGGLWAATAVTLLALLSPKLVVYFSSNSFSQVEGHTPKKTTTPKTQTIILGIKGMTCGGCIGNVTRALKSLPGIVQAEVTYTPKQRARIRYNPEKSNHKQIIAAIQRIGYQAWIIPIPKNYEENKHSIFIKPVSSNTKGVTAKKP